MPIVEDKDYHRALVESLAAAQAEIERLTADNQRLRVLTTAMSAAIRAALDPKP